MNSAQTMLPVDIVFHPSWWNAHVGMTFDEDLFYHPKKRVESERKMEQVLYDRFGKHGLGEHRHDDLPVIGAVHNAAGYLDFLDVGWGGDLRVIREHLPNTFLNIRLDPVQLVNWTPEEIRETIIRLVADSGDPALTGVCCINLDQNATDEQIDAILECVDGLRREKGTTGDNHNPSSPTGAEEESVNDYRDARGKRVESSVNLSRRSPEGEGGPSTILLAAIVHRNG